MTQMEMIPYIKDAIEDFSKRTEKDYHHVMMSFGAVSANYNLLVADRFESKEEYEFFIEFVNRSHDVFYQVTNDISNKSSVYSQNNYFPLRLILSTMLFGIERRDKNLVYPNI